jgi:hypothetical protein
VPAGSVTTDRLDYLQRSGSEPDIGRGARTEGVAGARRLLRVRGIGRPEKDSMRSRNTSELWRPATAELITGLYGYRIPLAFSLVGSVDGVRIQLGTWSARAAAAPVQTRRVAVIDSVLRGLYPVVDLEAVDDEPSQWTLGGMALGVPAPAGLDESDGAAPIDRIIRSMTGANWAALVLAYPASEAAIGHVRDSVINEMRAVESAAKNELAPSPLTDQYVALLTASLAAAGEGLAMGAWRTGVYLLGDENSYPRLASAWRSVMSSEGSLPEPVRVFDRPEVAALAHAWALPDEEGASPPGFYRRPFECQTLLSTAQLAACVHLPELEAPGFSVKLVPRFDVVAPTVGDDGTSLVIGQVLQHRQATAGTYAVTLRSLCRHVFVAGLTGSGKTNTIMSMLQEAADHDIPFLVVEPAKTEYRALIDHPKLGPRMRVFTAGKATVAPFVLNPFEVPEGTTVNEHLNLLRAVFTAAFGMWTPLPQILEQCLHGIYVDRGWDLRTNLNSRLTNIGDTTGAFPTLSDLIAKTNEVIPALGYEEKVTGDLKAALVTRLQSLRHGSKGAMLDVARSLPPEELFGQPTVVELESLGDEGDKAFFSGLLLIRLAEYRRTQGQSADLVHLLVVEEAHRLLSNVPTGMSEETANPRGEAVETFANLLSEIRAYGQGVVIADQVPVRLAPDVMKNTNLKIAHRVVSADDREALAGAMAMDERQAKALTSLEVGEAAVFSGGDDAPLLVRIPLVKDPLSPTPPSDARVHEHMARWREETGLDDLFLPQPFCAATCATPAACEAARRLVDDEYVQRTLSRTVLSTIDEPTALDRLWEDMTVVVRARRPVTVPDGDLLRAVVGHGSDWLATRRGAQGVWTYTDTSEFRDRLRATLLAKLDGTSAVPATLVAALQDTAHRLHAREFEPYPACHLVCTQDPPVCLYRSAVADLVTSGRYHRSWNDADDRDANSEDNRRRETWEVCQDAAFEVVEFPDPDMPAEVKQEVEVAARRVCLCFEQQMLADDRRKVPRTTRRILARVLGEAGL